MFEQTCADLLGKVTDERVRELLQANADGDPNARERVYDYLVAKFKELREQQKEEQDPGSPVLPALKQTARIDQHWAALAGNIRIAAELLWRGRFLRYKFRREAWQEITGGQARWISWSGGRKDPPAEIGVLRQITRRSRQLMLLWLESSLFRMRSSSNYQAREQVRVGQDNPTRKAIGDLFREYLGVARTWDGELRGLTGQAFFQRGPGDIQQFKAFEKRFGPELLTEQDEGWAAQVADAKDELRFQLLDEIRRQRWRDHKYFSWLAYGMLKATTGYGTRPVYFLRVSGLILVAFWFLFFLNDFLNPGIRANKHFCPSTTTQVTSWYDPILIAIRYLYIAVTNLSSLGSNSDVAHYCGGAATQVLLISSALAGYFLLALLAALFFRLLTEAE